MRITRLMLLFVSATAPSWASGRHTYPDPSNATWSQPSSVTCETVRAVVRQLGLEHAKALARANGMTAEQERRAKQCLIRS